MFIRFRLRLLSRRIERVGRRMARCQNRHSRLRNLSQVLTYQRRFFQGKLEGAQYAPTLRGYIRALFRAPKTACDWRGPEAIPPSASDLAQDE